MLPNNRLFVIWVLDGFGLCEDVIRWEVLEWLVDYEKVIDEWYEDYELLGDIDHVFLKSCECGYSILMIEHHY